jgi:hypothetical protein
MPKAARAEARPLRDFYARQVQCVVCGRVISRRKGWTCSIRCQERGVAVKSLESRSIGLTTVNPYSAPQNRGPGNSASEETKEK